MLHRCIRLAAISFLGGLSVGGDGGWFTAAAQSARKPEAAAVRPLFDLRSPERSPFPSDRFTVADANQNTGRRVNLPMPDDCKAQVSECEDRAVLNQLDGFNMQPRISVPFDGEIDPASVNNRAVFLGKVGEAARIGINQIVWDPATRELSFQPDDVLEQHTTYVLVVTTGLRDAGGKAIAVAGGVRSYRNDLARDVDPYYRRALMTAEEGVRRAGDAGRGLEIAALSVFTTQSFSHIIERMRQAIERAPVPRLEFGVGPGGARAVFNAAQLQSLTNNTDVKVNGPLTPQPIQIVGNARVFPGGIGTVAFGTLRALDFTTRPSGHVAAIATRTGTLAATGSLDVAFDLFLPSGAPPAGGWPVAMCGHGSGAGKNYCFTTAPVLTSHRIAVISLNGMGHGTGPRTTMTAVRTDGTTMTFAAPGLGYDQDGDGTIEAYEPRLATRPSAIYGTSGVVMQSAAQYLQLVRTIQAGVDVDGDGRADLDASRIYYVGMSLGGPYGMMAFACEPAIRAAVFVVPPGSLVYNTRHSPGYRSILAESLAGRIPSLINGEHGVKTIDGQPAPQPFFNENLPLRNVPPLINNVPGAMAIQKVLDYRTWAEQASSSVALAQLLRRSPPAGVAPRPFVIQMARSDPASTNPGTTQMIRSGDFADRVLLYRHDLNFGNAGVPATPHLFLGQVAAEPAYSRIALGAQHQIGTFFETDGATVTHPTPTEFWEAPIRLPLPEDLFYMPRPR